MGQRFQMIENKEGSIKVYHSQWLWGDYAIRRIGTAVRNFIEYNKEGHRAFEEYLKGSFYGKPNDMNSVRRYFGDEDYNDNKILAEGRKQRKFKDAISELDNNDGYFYIEVDRDNKIKGYCFLRRDSNFKPLTSEEYLKEEYRQKGFSKEQEEEFKLGRETFKELNLIEIPEKIYNKE